MLIIRVGLLHRLGVTSRCVWECQFHWKGDTEVRWQWFAWLEHLDILKCVMVVVGLNLVSGNLKNLALIPFLIAKQLVSFLDQLNFYNHNIKHILDMCMYKLVLHHTYIISNHRVAIALWRNCSAINKRPYNLPAITGNVIPIKKKGREKSKNLLWNLGTMKHVIIIIKTIA